MDTTLESSKLAWALYELHKTNWVADNPEATPDEYAAACRKIADELGL